MRVYISNMECPESRYLVKNQLDRLGITIDHVENGIIDFNQPITKDQLNVLAVALKPYGHKILNENIIIRKIKSTVQELVRNPEIESKTSVKEFISGKLKMGFGFLNSFFIEKTGVSIEKYFSTKKVEHIMELLVYYELLNEFKQFDMSLVSLFN
jgi:hypothetical protein